MAAEQSAAPVEEFPGLDLAYERAIASYQEIAARSDAANQRIDGLLTLTSTVTLAAPIVVAATGTGAALRSPILLVVAGLFAVVLLLGVAGRGLAGTLRFVDPFELYESWLPLEQTDFKLESVYWAGEHVDHGMRIVWRKSLAAHVMTALFAVEVLTLLVWIGTAL